MLRAVLRYAAMYIAVLFWIVVHAPLFAQSMTTRVIFGIVMTQNDERVPGATVVIDTSNASFETVAATDGTFRTTVPAGALTVRVRGNYIDSSDLVLHEGDSTENLRIQIAFKLPAVHESLVITASALNPAIDQRNGNVYKNTLFSRDDQIFETLAAGINAGQHEGGGKSLEIRRFGFNLDHGGVNGGLKVLVDDVQQNQSTQSHGQGYLGALKTLTPELVDDVEILNGPFSAEYGDFSGLGVVHIRLKETLPDLLTVRLQGGSFGSFRGFIGYSPSLTKADAFLSYEGSHNDGPFLNPLRYNRHNVTGNYTRHLTEKQTLGFKLNFGTSDFFSSGQIPLKGATRLQPKANLSYTPSARLPLTFHASYGRGISSQDARGVIQFPGAPKVATTDFYQLGTSHQLNRVSLSTDVFLIDRSNEQVYIPDDGTIEFKGPSRSYGWEAKTSVQLLRRLVLNGGFTQVSNAFYRGTEPRTYVDSAPHSVGNAGLTLTGWHGFNSSIRYRHISSYRLIGAYDPRVPRASGLDVIDFSASKRLNHAVDFNFAVDNLTNKRYWETQNYFASRLPGEPREGVMRVHGTPGFPIGVTIGMTFHFAEK